MEDSSANMSVTSSVVDHKGNIVLEDVGIIRAAGRTLEAIRHEIEQSMQQVPDSQNAFQIQITNFSSQTALLTVIGQPGALIPITDKPSTLSDVLTQNGLSVGVDRITQVNLQRKGESIYLL